MAATLHQDYPPEFRIKAFRAALNVQDFQYKNWCITLLKCLEKLSSETDLHNTLKQDFINSPSHRISFIQRISKSYASILKLRTESITIFCQTVLSLIQSPLTSEQHKSILRKGMTERPTREFLSVVALNKATSFKSFVKSCFKNENLSSIAKNTYKVLEQTSNSFHDKLVQDLNYPEMKQALLNMEGKPQEGQQLFLRQSCIACHSVFPSEPQKGPYLGTVGNLFDREQLITHIVKPNEEVAQGFQSYTFSLIDGSAIHGFVTAKDEKTITVRSMVGTSQVIEKAQVKSETVNKNSMMPAGIVNSLSLKQFASLLDYLQSLH